MSELPAEGLPDGAIIVHRVGAVRYLNPADGESHLLLIVQDADGNEIDDISSALGDITLIGEAIVAQWRRHNGETL